MNRGSSFIPMMVVFFAIVMCVLAFSIPKQTYANIVWAASNNYASSGWDHSSIIGAGLALGFFFLLLFGGLASMTGGSSRRTRTHASPSTMIEVVVGNQRQYIPKEDLESEGLSYEEIENATGDVRREEVRDQIKAERKQKGRQDARKWSQQPDFHTSRFDKYAPPDQREQTNSGNRVIDSYMSELRRMFKGASVRFTGNIFHGKDIEFSMRGRKQMEMSNNGHGKYRIILTSGRYGDYSQYEVYQGGPSGAVEVVKRWYDGDKLQTTDRRNISTTDEEE